jgi:xanthine dehydrogenase accessory factor
MENIFEKIAQITNSNQTAVLITIVETKGHSPADSGAKMLLLENGETLGTVGGGALEHNALKQAKQVLETGKNLLKTYILDTKDLHHKHEVLNMACGGSATLFYEFLGTKENILIFGGGHIGKALLYHLSPLNFNITVFDDRQEIREEFEKALQLSDLNKNHLHTNPYIIIATHSHTTDYKMLKQILQQGTNSKYIGVVASKNKFKEMKKQLTKELKEQIDFNRIYAPVGLSVGGRSPNEIALSIVSEILSVKYKKEKIINLRNK